MIRSHSELHCPDRGGIRWGYPDRQTTAAIRMHAFRESAGQIPRPALAPSPTGPRDESIRESRARRGSTAAERRIDIEVRILSVSAEWILSGREEYPYMVRSHFKKRRAIRKAHGKPFPGVGSPRRSRERGRSWGRNPA